jgi:hypothetical protein
MNRTSIAFSFFMLLLFSSISISDNRDIAVVLQLFNDTNKDNVIQKANLLIIKDFIIKKGKRETYCNMFNNNPAFHTNKYSWYLNPDTGQDNLNCDLKKSDFNNITIRIKDPKDLRDQYRDVEFAGGAIITITAPHPSEELSIKQIKSFVVDAMQEIIKTIDDDNKNK